MSEYGETQHRYCYSIEPLHRIQTINTDCKRSIGNRKERIQPCFGEGILSQEKLDEILDPKKHAETA